MARRVAAAGGGSFPAQRIERGSLFSAGYFAAGLRHQNERRATSLASPFKGRRGFMGFAPITPDPNRKYQANTARASLSASGFPERALAVAYGEFKPRVVLSRIWDSIICGGTSLLYGPVGVGKTVGVTRMGAAWLHAGYSIAGMPRYWTAYGLLSQVKDRFNTEARKRGPDPIEKAKAAGLLILDECGREVGSNFDIQQIHDLIDTRQRNFRPTVLVSNYTESQLRKHYGAPTIDRLGEAEGGAVVEMEGKSMRGVVA